MFSATAGVYDTLSCVRYTILLSIKTARFTLDTVSELSLTVIVSQKPYLRLSVSHSNVTCPAVSEG